VADNVIELNGKRYDAVTGAYLGVARTPATPAVHHAKKGRAIDGFIRPTPTNTVVAPAAKHHTAAKPVSSVHKPATKTVAADVKPLPAKKQRADVVPNGKKTDRHTLAHAHRAATAARAHTPEHTHTLMRHVVRKPEVTIKPAIKPQAPAEIAAKPVSAIVHKRSALQVDPARLERAKAIAKHAGIRRFMPVHPDHNPATIAATPHRASGPIPVIAVRPAPPQESHHRHPQSDIFEAAIARADSHKQPAHHVRRGHRRLVNTLAVIGAFVIIGGFITYLNIPNIQLHIASVQAGFKADLPDYKPTGYALQGGVKRTGNTVSVTYRSGDSSYTITQQPSDWNSQTLAENTLALSGDNHQTVDANGRIVYIYDGNNAVWVNGGVRYDLNTHASLTTDDITKLAASL